MQIKSLINKTRNLFLLPSFMFLILILPMHAEEKTSVTWAIESFPPLYILEGNNRGKGTVDLLLDLLEEEMKDVEHERKFLPILRIIEGLKSKDQIACASFLYDPNTIEYAQYSEPLFAVPPQMLIINKSKWLEMGSPKSISLTDLLKSDKLHLGLGKGRNYGKILTKIIDQEKHNNPKLYFRVGDHFNGLADMIVHERIDATIAYGGEAKYYLSQSKTPDALVHIPIEENDQTLLVYIVIPKSEWGDAFIKLVNEAIFRIRLKPEYLDSLNAWFDHTESFDYAINNLIQHSKLHLKVD